MLPVHRVGEVGRDGGEDRRHAGPLEEPHGQKQAVGLGGPEGGLQQRQNPDRDQQHPLGGLRFQQQAVEQGGKAKGQQHGRHEQGPAGRRLAELPGQQGQDGLRGIDRRVDGDGGDKDEGGVAQEHRVFMPAFYPSCNCFLEPPAGRPRLDLSVGLC